MKNPLRAKHVTLFIGFCDLLIHISILFCIFASITNPDMLDTVLTNQSVDSISQPASPVPKEIAYPPMISDANKKYHTFFMEFPSMVEFKKHNTMLNTTEVFTNNNRHRMPSKLHDKSVGILVTCCSSLMTLMLIYGCLYDKASYLMPYFSIKVFQIVISSLSTLGFYSSLPDVKHQLKLASNFPFKDLLMTYDRHTLELIIFGFFLSTILVKLFVAINVWYCYRQLMTLEAMYDQENYAFRNASNGYVAGLEMAFTENEKDLGRYGGVGLPPKYDDIVKGSAPNQTKSSDKKRDQTNGDSELMESFQKPPTYISVAHLNQK